MNWHLITFASGVGFKESANRLLREANKSKMFETCVIFDESDLKHDIEFWKQYGAFFEEVNHARGYGRWFWKPKIILDALMKMPAGDGLLYLDAGSHLNLRNKRARTRLCHYFELAVSNSSLAFEVGKDANEFLFTHPQVIQDMGLSLLQQSSPQIEAGAIFLINNSDSREFLEIWQFWMSKDDFKYLLAQEFILENQARIGRDDQSIMSCVYKIRGMHYIRNETYFYPHWRTHGKHYPIWHTRERAGKRIAKTKVSILLRSYVNRARGLIVKRPKSLH
jgi:hypothetical protein